MWDTTFTQHLYLAIELSKAEWKLGFTVGLGQAPRLRSLTARELTDHMEEIRLSKIRFGLPESAPVVSCYEAGRDGFWLHRYLTTLGITNLIVDSASIEVNRRRRRVKTDRLDVGKLLMMLVRYVQARRRCGVCRTRPAHRKKTSASCTVNRWRSSASGPGTSTASKACWPVRG